MAVAINSSGAQKTRNRVPVIHKDTFDRLSRVQRATLLVMQEYGEVTIVNDVHEEERGKEQNPAPRRAL